MTGLCCRCQVRHDDELCCRHGVICNGDVDSPAEVGDLGALFMGEDGIGDLLLLVAGTVVFAAVLGGAAWMGYNASDGWKLAAAVVLGVASLPVLRWAMRYSADESERQS